MHRRITIYASNVYLIPAPRRAGSEKMSRKLTETLKFTGSIRQFFGRGYYVRVPIRTMRKFLRTLPQSAHTAYDGIIVDVELTWEGLVE